MTVFAFWDATPSAPPRQAELVGAWYRRTVEQGSIPRLLTARDALRPKANREAAKLGPVDLPALALRAKRGKVLFDLRHYERDL